MKSFGRWMDESSRGGKTWKITVKQRSCINVNLIYGNALQTGEVGCRDRPYEAGPRLGIRGQWPSTKIFLYSTSSEFVEEIPGFPPISTGSKDKIAVEAKPRTQPNRHSGLCFDATGVNAWTALPLAISMPLATKHARGQASLLIDAHLKFFYIQCMHIGTKYKHASQRRSETPGSKT